MSMDAGTLWPPLLAKLMRGEELTAEEAGHSLATILEGRATPAQIAGFAVALRAKGETPAEMAALVRTMLAYAERVDVEGPLLDTCGTGGDRSCTINVSTLAAFLVELGTERALVFFGHDGLDELTTTTTSAMWEVIDGEVRFSNLDPTELGIPLALPEDLVGGDPAANARLARAVLDGETGPQRDIVVLNAGAALRAAGGVAALAAGIHAAAASLDGGRAAAALDRLVKISREAAEEQ